jgi:hypothetical protein
MLEHPMFEAVSERMRARSAAVLTSLDGGLDRIMKAWLFVMLMACSARVAAAPAGIGNAGPESFLGYLLLVIAPVASTVFALRWFEAADGRPQLSTRLALVGRWRDVPAEEARAHPLYGTSGIMVSLLLGMLLNVPVRAAEFLAAMPPIPRTAPDWASVLQTAMTFDVVLFTSLYPIAFVAALRRSPIFPRLLVAIWGADIVMQLAIAQAVTAATHLPPAVADALQSLLTGNVQKVLISMCLWLPYLLLSTRVNVTYRQRVPAVA